MEEAGKILETLAAEGNLRQLRGASPDGKYVTYDGTRYLNMSSNDYLGLGSDTALQREFLSTLDPDRFAMGNPASRLMTGNSLDYELLEAVLASLYPGKDALVLSSGYMVNSGVLPALTGKGDLILADKYVHASIIDGLKLCDCQWRRFSHNDLSQVESILIKSRRDFCNVWLVTESVFSMDGDRAPLRELVELKSKYGIKLYVDEAHAFGVYGEKGEGLAAEEGLAADIDVIVGTFGKAYASCGAFAALDPQLKQLLVNRMRTLIFSTALPPVNLMWTRFLLERTKGFGQWRKRLASLVKEMMPGNPQATHIIPLMAYGNEDAIIMAGKFREAGFWVTPIRYPTVPKGKARVRISLTASMGIDDIINFKGIWKNIGTDRKGMTDL